MNSRLRRLTECSIMIALGTVLSLLKLVDLPAGGSVTIASMLPLVLLSYRHGCATGLVAGIAFGAIQQLLGLNTLSYVTTWYSVLAVILLDYVLAYAVVGLAGVFRRCISHQALALAYGAALVSVLRYALHVISGATVWAGLSIPTEAALLYSFGYNATYMLPEAIILLTTVYYLGSVLDFREATPTRMRAADFSRGAEISRLLGGLCAVLTIVLLSVTVLPVFQDPESGDFVLSRITTLDPTLPLTILGVGAVLTAALFGVYALLHARYPKKSAEN